MKFNAKFKQLAVRLAIGAACAPTLALAQQVVKIDGSSTVYPITEGIAEDFQKSKKNAIKVTVGISGTGGGFKKFCRGETDISNASRPILTKEMADCKAAGVEYYELPVAFDALTVVINPKNTFIKQLTVAELKKMWEPAAQGKVTMWNQVNSAWPAQPLKLFGAGADSGTFDYFTEAIMGKADQSRGDYTSSEDDNVIVQGISGDEFALGYFGFAYYEENAGKLKLVPVDDGNETNGAGPIPPSPETVKNGSYAPLSRPIFVYPKVKALDRPEVTRFVDFYLTTGVPLVREVGYIPLSDREYDLVRARFAAKKSGSVYQGTDSHSTVTLEQRLAQ